MSGEWVSGGEAIDTLRSEISMSGEAITNEDGHDMVPCVVADDRPKPGDAALDGSSHRYLLAVSVAVLALSCLLSVRGEQDVVVPGINFTLPGLCTAQRMFGVDCPGCGLTRSFISLAHGDVRRAWHFNAVGILFFLFIAAQIP